MTLLHETIRADSPAVYWPFDEVADGATCFDRSGNGRNGGEAGTGASLAATTLVVPGHPRSCLNVGDGYWHSNGNATDTNLDVGTGDFTYEVWLKITNPTSNYVEIAGRDSGGTGSGQLLMLNITTGGCRVWCGGTALNAPTRVSDGKSHHVVFRRIAGTMAIFVDAVLDASAAAAGSTDGVARALRVGVTSGTYQRPLGNWAHFAYYKSGLTDAKVLNHYRIGLQDGLVY